MDNKLILKEVRWQPRGYGTLKIHLNERHELTVVTEKMSVAACLALMSRHSN